MATIPWLSSPPPVPEGSLLRGGDVAVYVLVINQPSLPTPFYSVLVSISVFMALSTWFPTPILSSCAFSRRAVLI